MLRNLLTVGGWTIASRVSSFFRDVLLGAVLGAGAIADAFVIAFRLPNHFRAIFGEGAFNSAYVPAYSRALEMKGPEEAKRFSSQIFTLLLISQLVFLAFALSFTPQFIRVLAPGFESDPEKFTHAVTLTRITFPYLFCITLVTLHSDTIISSLLPTGGPSSIYYADRIYQLPVGVIGIAAGTVLLPEMSRLFAAGDAAGARHAQNRTMALTLTLAAPFLVAFLIIPDLIMRAVFVRGRFTIADADTAASVLAAYGIGLLAVVLIRSAVASFQAKGDTTTPMIIALAAVAVNVLLKIILFRPFGAPGLAFATAIGAWLNLVLLIVLALKRGTMQFDDVFMRSAFATAAGAVVLANVGLWGRPPLEHMLGGVRLSNEIALVALMIVGGLLYCGFLLFGLRALGIRFSDFRGRSAPRPVRIS